VPGSKHWQAPGVPEELLYLDVLSLVIGGGEVLQHLGPAHQRLRLVKRLHLRIINQSGLQLYLSLT
jgi:hypothetical protein